MKKASWIVLAVAGALTLLASLASLSNAYFGGAERIGGRTIEQLANGSPEVMTALRARRATAAAYAAGFATFLLLIALGPYRRGDAWAWWAILIGTLTEALLVFARIPFLGTRAGTAAALVQLVVVGIGLALDAGRVRGAPPVVMGILCAMATATSAMAETHRFTPTVGYPTFAVRTPVLTVRPGDVLESESLWGEWYEKAGGKWPGEVGPIAIEGAEPGDTLVVEVLKVRPNRPTAVSTQGGGFGALVPDDGTAFLNERFPRGRYVWRLDRERMTGTVDLPGSKSKSMTIPLRPMLGRVAVAPEGDEQFGGMWPGPFGGNMDVSDVREGTTVSLPVFHKGALFYFGDGHAAQGDGEVCGSGLETSMEVALRFDLVKKKAIDWPRLEDAEHIMVAGSARPLSDALRISFVELVNWLVADYGFDKADAYQVVSQSAVIRVGNMVDPLYTVVAKFPKRLLRAPDAVAGVRLGGIPWTDAEKLLGPDRVVVLPLGAGSKEHGPHLLLGNDQLLADGLAARLLQARPVAMLPTLTYGFYPAFLEYPGSVSLSADTQRDVVMQICRSIARYGPRRFYVLNTGVSTAPPLKAAAEGLAAEGILMRFTDIISAGKAAEDAVRQQKAGTHADEMETSAMLYLAPASVRMEKAVADGMTERAGPLTRDVASATGHVSPSGVFGDPTLATWQKGQRLSEAMVASIVSDIDMLATAAVPAGTPLSPLAAGGAK
jgi:acetamidase/formamidase/creatinine amidohydrolase/Fe(II)-dependent formamide hydrolase-like protein